MKKCAAIVLASFLCLFVAMCGAHTSPQKVYAERASITLPVVMYHSILNSRTGKYIVSERQLENDLIAYEQAGYVTVFPSEVIAYVKGEGTLPQKPIMLTFDDGNYNNLAYGAPILLRHRAKALISIVGVFSDKSTNSKDNSNLNYSNLTWQQVGEVAKLGCFELGNHTYDLHKYQPRFGVSKMPNESYEKYANALTTDIGALQNKIKEMVGVAPQVFTYPFGKMCDSSAPIIKSLGFEMLLTCSEGTNTIIKGYPKCLDYIFRYNRDGRYSSAYFVMNKIA